MVPPSHLLKHQACPLSGGAFVAEFNNFMDDYYNGKVVLGRSRGAQPVEWEDTGVGRSYDQFFIDYPPIVREDPFTVFKETRPVKRH